MREGSALVAISKLLLSLSSDPKARYMNDRMKPRLAQALLSFPFALACSSSSSPPPTTDTTLIGTWQAPTYQAAANGNASVAGTTTLQLQRTTETTDAIGSLSVTLDLQYAMGGSLAGCHEKVTMTGLFTTNDTGLHAPLSNGRIVRDACVKASDDTMPNGPITFDYDATATSAALTGIYKFSSGGKTLTINGISYTRQ